MYASLDQCFSLTIHYSTEFMQIFYLFDKQGDGKIEIHQIGDACRALGLNPKQDVIKKLVNQLDNERNGEMPLRLAYTVDLNV